MHPFKTMIFLFNIYSVVSALINKLTACSFCFLLKLVHMLLYGDFLGQFQDFKNRLTHTLKCFLKAYLYDELEPYPELDEDDIC